MKQYSINLSFANGNIICVKSPKTELETEEVTNALKERGCFIDENGNCYSINMDNLNYYMIYELREREVEEETPAHTEA